MNKMIKPRPIIFALIGLISLLASVSESANYTLKVDGSVTQKDVPHFWSECVGCGTAHLTLRADVTSAYRIGHKECGFKRVRGHGLFNNLANEDKTGLFHWNGNVATPPTYTWGRFDAIMDSIKATGMQPLVELSFMPKDLAVSSTRSTCRPKNYEVWRDLIDSTVSHCIKRYGKEEVESWYWEVWNEPDYGGFWDGTADDYFKLYKYTVEGATRALPTILIGGPSSCDAGPALGYTPKTPKVAYFLDYCKTNNLRVNFASCHHYAVTPNQVTTADPIIIRDDNRDRQKRIKASGLTNVKSFNTEWSSSYAGQGGGSNNPGCVSMDSHANAPFVVRAVKAILDDYTNGLYPVPDVFSYWVISDIFDEGNYYIQNHNEIPFAQVFGLMNYQGLRKATFNAFKMLHKMGNTRISMTGGDGADKDGVDGFATLNAAKDSLGVIIYNQYRLLGTTGTDEVNLTIDKAPFQTGASLKINHYRVDIDHSNPYEVWVKQGKQGKPSTSQWEALRAAQNLADIETQSTMTFQGGAITRAFTLPKQGVSLILVTSQITAVTPGIGFAKPFYPVLLRNGKLFVNTRPGNSIRIFMYSASGKIIGRRDVFGGQTFAINESVGSNGLCIIHGEAEGKKFTRKILITSDHGDF